MAEPAKGAQVRERAALRRGQRALAAASVLFVCLIVVGTGVYYQDLLKEQYRWRFVMRPSVLTATREKEIAAKPGSDFKECANGCPTMIVVPAGKFMMGTPEPEKDRVEDTLMHDVLAHERPQHEVAIAKPFEVGKTDVTFAEWDICFAAGACPNVSDNHYGREDHPVINVSWEEAKGYVAWLRRLTGKDYRLLTEAEWEYAARGGNQARWSFGDDEAQIDEYAWYGMNAHGATEPVATKKPNAFGLYDMHGNISQYVEDCMHWSYDGAPSDGSAWVDEECSRRVVRGGNVGNLPDFLRSAQRAQDSTYERYYLGFRVARTLSP